jgi:hypothetical protein
VRQTVDGPNRRETIAAPLVVTWPAHHNEALRSAAPLGRSPDPESAMLLRHFNAPVRKGDGKSEECSTQKPNVCPARPEPANQLIGNA